MQIPKKSLLYQYEVPPAIDSFFIFIAGLCIMSKLSSLLFRLGRVFAII
jgi:hypothetical protein